MTPREFRDALSAVACPATGCKKQGTIFAVAGHLNTGHGWPFEETARWFIDRCKAVENPPQGALFTPGRPPDADLALRDP